MPELPLYVEPAKLSTSKKIQVDNSMELSTAEKFNVAQVSVIPPSDDHTELLNAVDESTRGKMLVAIEKQHAAALKKERAAALIAAGGGNLSCELSPTAVNNLAVVMEFSGHNKKNGVDVALQIAADFYRKNPCNGKEKC